MTDSMRTGERAYRFGLGTAWTMVAAVAQIVAAVNDAGPPIQPLLPVVFVLTVPGSIIFDFSKPSDVATRVLFAVAGSIAFNIVLVSAVLLPQFSWMLPVVALAAFEMSRFFRARLVRSENERTADIDVDAPA